MNNIKISLWSSFLVELTPEKMVNSFVEHGYQCTEISDEHGAELLKRGNASTVGEELYKYANECGFSFPQGHLWLSADIVEPDTAERMRTIDKLKSWLELFTALGVKAAVLHPSGAKARAAGWDEEKIFQTRAESLGILLDFIKDTPVSIAMENCGEDINQMLAIVDAMDNNSLGICLDTGHLNLSPGEQGEFIRRCNSKLLALHIADNLGERDDHIFPYTIGTVDWSEVMAALNDISYNGLFNFEVPGESHCPQNIKDIKMDYALALGKSMLGAK